MSSTWHMLSCHGVYIHPSPSQSYKHFTLHSSWMSSMLWCYFTNTHTHTNSSFPRSSPTQVLNPGSPWSGEQKDTGRHQQTYQKEVEQIPSTPPRHPAVSFTHAHTLQPRVVSNWSSIPWLLGLTMQLYGANTDHYYSPQRNF